jgi:hypothetical protein
MDFGVSARFRLTTLSLVLLVVLALALPASAGAYLYWVEDSHIDRANLNGSGVVEGFIPRPEPYGALDTIALSGSYIYLADRDSGMVGHVDLNGGGGVPDLFTIPQPVSEEGLSRREVNATSLAVEEPYIYWSSANGGSPIGDAIGRARVDGGSIEPDFIKTQTPAYEVTVAAGHIYWITEHGIARANLDGRGLEEDFIPLHEIKTNGTDLTDHIADGIAVAEDHIYWATERGIARANLDGREVDLRFITGLPYVYGVAVGAGYVYWKASDARSPEPLTTPPWAEPSYPEWIGRANIDGGGIQQHLMTFTRFPAESLTVNARGPGAGHPTNHMRPNHRYRRHRANG